jgi:hypothetical protein
MTSSMWIRPLPTLKTNAPRIHPITRITASIYNMSLIKLFLVLALSQKTMPAGGKYWIAALFNQKYFGSLTFVFMKASEFNSINCINRNRE